MRENEEIKDRERRKANRRIGLEEGKDKGNGARGGEQLLIAKVE